MAKDLFHDSVVLALQKEGWTITHDPYIINNPQMRPKQEIDLGAEKMLAAERGVEKIAVEVKSFINHSLVYEFHLALGQYLNYSIGLEVQEPERVLFLAIPHFADQVFEDSPLIRMAIEKYKVKFIVYDAINKNIVLWKN